MFNAIFYHNLTRKYSTVFGSYFEDIIVRRFDKSNNTVQTVPVPIKYASKQYYIQQLTRPQEDVKVQMQLPSISFMLNNISYDAQRRVSQLNKNVRILENNTKTLKSQFTPMPYLLDFDLTIWARSHDDAWQIMEQIVPYFTPSFTSEIKLIPDMDIKLDTKTTFQGISMQDNPEGSVNDTFTFVWTLNFQMECWYFGPISNQGVIKRVQLDFIAVPGSGPMESTPNFTEYGRSSRVVLTPGLTANGEPTTDPNNTIPYDEIEWHDPYGIIEQTYFFQDGKKYDPKSGKDKSTKKKI